MVIDTALLSPAQKIMLAEDLWDSVLGNIAESSLSDSDRLALEIELNELENDTSGISWSQLKNKIESKLHG